MKQLTISPSVRFGLRISCLTLLLPALVKGENPVASLPFERVVPGSKRDRSTTVWVSPYSHPSVLSPGFGRNPDYSPSVIGGGGFGGGPGGAGVGGPSGRPNQPPYNPATYAYGGDDSTESPDASYSSGCGSCSTCDLPGPYPKLVPAGFNQNGTALSDMFTYSPFSAGGGSGGGGGGGGGGSAPVATKEDKGPVKIPINVGDSRNPSGGLATAPNAGLMFNGNTDSQGMTASIANLQAQWGGGASLKWSSASGTTYLRQAKSDSVILVGEPIDAGNLEAGSRFKIYTYVGEPSLDSNGFYDVSQGATELNVTEITKATVGSDEVLTVTSTTTPPNSTAVTRRWKYTRSGSEGSYTWTLTEEIQTGSAPVTFAAIREQSVEPVSGTSAVLRKYKELADGALATTSVAQEVWTEFTMADGSVRRRLLERTAYADAAAAEPVRRVVWTYYSDPTKPASYGRAASRRDYGYDSVGVEVPAYWEDYEYSKTYAGSEVTTIYKPHNNSPAGDYSLATKVVRTDYAPPVVTGMSPEEAPEANMTEIWTVGTGPAQYVGYRSVSVIFGTTLITATDSTYTGQASTGSSVTKREYFPPTETAAKRLRLKTIVNPDGTVVAFDYLAGAGTDVVHTMQLGHRVGTTDTYHTKIERTYNRQGYQIDEKVTDLGTSQVTSRWTVPLDENNALRVDTLGRPKRIEYNGNSADYRSFIFDCCGLSEFRDRDGRTTYQVLDALRRPMSVTEAPGTAAAVTTAYTYSRRLSGATELGGFKTSTTRAGAFESSVTIDAAKRTLASESPDADGANGSELTTTAYEALSAGTFRETTTLPDGATSIREVFGSGALAFESGTATPDSQLTYGLWQPPGSTYRGRTVQRTALTTAGAPMESVTSYYDTLGRLVQEQRAHASGVATRSWVYNAKTQLVRTTDEDGVTTLYAYNARGERTQTALDLNGNGSIDVATDRISEVERSVINDTSAGGKGLVEKTEQFVYFPGSSTRALVSTRWVATNGLKGWADDSGALTSWEINRFTAPGADPAAGREVTTSLAADGTKRVETTLLWRPHRSEFRGTTDGLITWSEVTDYDYALRQPKERKDSRNDHRTQWTYWPNGSLKSEKNVDANETTFHDYDKMGRLVKTTLPTVPGANNIQQWAYHATGKLAREWGGLKVPVRYGYDEQNRLVTMDTFRGLAAGAEPPASGGSYDRTTWNYEPATGRLASKADAAGQVTAYEYSRAGRLTKRTWARTVGGAPLTTTYSYALASGVPGDDSTASEVSGALTLTDYSDATPDVTRSYDRLGRLASVTDAIGTRTFQYVAGKLLLDSETLPPAFITGTAATLQLTRSYQGGTGNPNRYTGYSWKVNGTEQAGVTYTYDSGTGRLSQLVSGGTPFATYGYVSNSNLVNTLSRPTSGGALVTTTTWFPHHDRPDIVENKLVSTVLSSYDYAVNTLGQRTGVTASGTAFAGDSAASWSWVYNAAGEVTGATRTGNSDRDRTYAYDGIGNRKMSRNGAAQAVGYEVAAANSTNAYTALFADTDGDGVRDAGEATTASPTHDADGNMTWDGVSGTAGRRFTWDGENRLVQVHNADATPQLLATYTYDYRSRRVQKVTTSMAPQGAQTRRCVYDGWNCIAEYDAAGALTSRHDWGVDLSGTLQGAGGVGGLVRTWVDGHNCFPTYDANGNVTELTDDTGTLRAVYQYDPFGNEVHASAPTVPSFAHRFSTKPRDPETAFNYYGYRYYSAALGRWLSRDPIGEWGGIALFLFVSNSPLEAIDILGLDQHALFSDDLNKSDRNAFEERAKQSAPENSKPYTTGQDLLIKCKALVNITGLDLHGHGNSDGMGGQGSGNGVYLPGGGTPSKPGVTASVEELAQAINEGKIDLRPNATIRIFHCRCDPLAKRLSELIAQKRPDVSITGAEGYVSPVEDKNSSKKSQTEKKAFTYDPKTGESLKFNTYKAGQKVRSQATMPYKP